MIPAFHVTHKDLAIGDVLKISECRQNTDRVYASTNPAYSILHASENKDASLQIFGRNGDADEIFERFPKALEEEFEDQKRYVYKIDGADDIYDDRQFYSERVFDTDKIILHKTEIKCALSEIKKYELAGVIQIHRYPNRPSMYICACTKLDKDLLIKELLEICKTGQDFSELKSIFEDEIKLPHNDLDELIDSITKAKDKLEVLAVLKPCQPSASSNDWIKLKAILEN